MTTQIALLGIDLGGLLSLVESHRRKHGELAKSIGRSATAVRQAVETIGESFSGSWFGWHAEMYYGNFERPPFVEVFDVEFGSLYGVPALWQQRAKTNVLNRVEELAGQSLTALSQQQWVLARTMRELHDDFLARVAPIADMNAMAKEKELLHKLDGYRWDESAYNEFVAHAKKRTGHTRDPHAAAQGLRVPAHVECEGLAHSAERFAMNAEEFWELGIRLGKHLKAYAAALPSAALLASQGASSSNPPVPGSGGSARAQNVWISDDSPAKHGVVILISHSSKDKALAEALIELLRGGLGLLADQIRCSSVDGYRLTAGVNSDEQLRTEVKSSALLIGLLTPNSLASTYVLFELGARWGAGLPMIPLLAGITPESMQGPYRVLNAMSCESEAQLIQLVEDVAKLLKIEAQRASSYLRQVATVKSLSASIQPTTAAISSELQAENVKLKTQLAALEEMEPFGPHNYFYRKGKTEGPYCPTCWQRDGKRVLLPASADYAGGKGRLCTVCKVHYIEEPRKQQPIVRTGGTWS